MKQTPTTQFPLHTLRFSRLIIPNRLFAITYAAAISALLLRHGLALFHSASFLSVSISVSDFFLAFMWLANQSFRMRPVRRRSQFPENLAGSVVAPKEFPALDVFVCTADPYKEPPMSVVNTALSVMAYDYPTEKLSVYVSDDGGSELTLFAFMEAAKFGSHWLPFCRKHKIVESCPEAYFSSNHQTDAETDNIKLKMMYERMKMKVENVVDRGQIIDEYMNDDEEREVFSRWAHEFTRQQHPAVIQVLLNNGEDKDMTGHPMPNLVYVSRQKSRASPHYFKAGALNALLRVSATMTNAAIVLTLDCDMYSNDPQTSRRVLCYFTDPLLAPTLAYVQFPQIFRGLNEADIYACEHKRLYQINSIGMDGLDGPCYVGSGCFFSRRAFFGGPSSFLSPENPELSPNHSIRQSISSPTTLDLAHHVAGCDYEMHTDWGSKIGFRYGTLSEDYFTGYKMQIEGWKSIFCHPDRPAFLGGMPISLYDVLNQNKRWAFGLLQVAFSKYSPLTFGLWNLGPIMGLTYAYYGFWPILSIPITIYAFLPQIALLNGVPIFPKVSERWFVLYAFCFVGAYGQDYLDFLLEKGTTRRWWSDQRMWLIRGVTSYPFGFIEYWSKRLGIVTKVFNVTSKVVDEEQSKRYEQGMFDFGVPQPMFVPLTMAAIINLVAFLVGLLQALRGGNLDGLSIQLFLAGFAVLNCLPIYEAMVVRTDKGKMPTKITILSTFMTWLLYKLVSPLVKK